MRKIRKIGYEKTVARRGQPDNSKGWDVTRGRERRGRKISARWTLMYCQLDIVNALVGCTYIYIYTRYSRSIGPRARYIRFRYRRSTRLSVRQVAASSWETRARQRHGQMSAMNRDERRRPRRYKERPRECIHTGIGTPRRERETNARGDRCRPLTRPESWRMFA